MIIMDNMKEARISEQQCMSIGSPKTFNLAKVPATLLNPQRFALLFTCHFDTFSRSERSVVERVSVHWSVYKHLTL